jgi:cytosolic carboxypeptidase protein 5
VEFITISSTKGMLNKEEDFADEHLFPGKDQPREFKPDKRSMIIGARVHPGEVPSSHVATGIIEELTADTAKGKLLRDGFVFYIFPIFNPDGVARGHYRVDTNGTNLNRCYLAPSAALHPAIYAVRRVILHFHRAGKYFAFLDLHAHAARKGAFIYGNATN